MNIPVLSFIALQALDAGTTYVGLTYFPGQELNGWIGFLMARFGTLEGLILVKAIGFALAGFIVWMRPRALWKMNAIFAVIGIWNLYQILRAL